MLGFFIPLMASFNGFVRKFLGRVPSPFLFVLDALDEDFPDMAIEFSSVQFSSV